MKNTVETQHIVYLVNRKKLSMREVEKQTGMTRQGIVRRLKSIGAFIPRRAKGGAPGKRITKPCAYCGAEVQRWTRQVLRSNQITMFCGQECYAASLALHPYEEWRHGSRLARVVVAQHFKLLPEHIVHHKDGNQRNNDRSNLVVFANQSQHLAHHRGRKVAPLWSGE